MMTSLLALSLLPLATAARLEGVVRDADGAPAEGVVMVAYDARLAYYSTMSDPEGAWAIGTLPAGAYRLRAAPPDDSGLVDRFYPSTWDYCTAERLVLDRAETRSGLDLVLPRGGEVSGRLVDPDGAPVAGATVIWEGQRARTALGVRLAETDADGRFVARGLDADPGVPEPWKCFVDVEDFPQQFLGPTYEEDDAVTFDVGVEDALDLGDEPLLAGITVAGVVRGPDGPVDSGTVYVYASSQAIATAIQPDGSYLGAGLPPGDVLAWAQSTGLATTYYPDADRPGASVPALEEGTALTGVDLSLPIESSLTLLFSGDGDLGEVSVLLYNSTYTVGRGSPVRDDGTVTIGALHPGTYTLYVYGSDGGFEDGFVSDADGEPTEFVVDGEVSVAVPLARGASLEGVVLGDDGAPVYGAYVTATPADGEYSETAVTDADGNWRLAGLLADTYTVEAQYTWYCPSDPGYVHQWWEGALVPENAALVELGRGDSRSGVDFTLPVDADHDGMGDAWEAEMGLDPSRDDAAEDADDDGFLNIDEYLMGTDPTSPGGGGGGCCGGKGESAAAWAALGLLGLARRRVAHPRP